MHYDGACPGIIVDIFFKPVEPKGITIVSHISLPGNIKSGTAF